MAGDLLITNIDEDDLSELLNAGGELVSTIFHSDKHGQTHWDSWLGRLTQGINGSTINNRVGLPPHFYINFKQSTYQGTGKPLFSRIIWASLRPLTIVSSNPALAGWGAAKSAYEAEQAFRQALQHSAITLEIYGYNGTDLINRGTGGVHAELAYMKLAPE